MWNSPWVLLLAALAAASRALTTDESCLQFSCANVGDGGISCDALWSSVCAHGTGALKVRAVCPHDCVAPGDEAEWRSFRRLLFADAPNSLNSLVASTRAVHSNGTMAEAHGERRAPDSASANADEHRAPDNIGDSAGSRLADRTLRSTAELALRTIAINSTLAATSRRLLATCTDAPDASIIKISAGFFQSWCDMRQHAWHAYMNWMQRNCWERSVRSRSCERPVPEDVQLV